jgi:hypothetical protein
LSHPHQNPDHPTADRVPLPGFLPLLRFGLKVLTVAIIAGGSFYYFWVDIRWDETT